MRILYVVGRLGMGGDSVAILNTLRVLIRKGELDVKDVDFVTHDIGYDKKTVEELRTEGFNIKILPGDVRKMNPVGYYRAFKRVLIKRGPYDVVHVHTSLQSGVALLVAKKCRVQRRVCHAHTNAIQRETSKLSEKIIAPILRKLILSNATDLLACSDMAGQFLYGNKNFSVVRNGIPLDRYRDISEEEIIKLRSQFSDNESTYIVGHVGRFSTMKNHEFILKLASKLEGENIRFVCVGDGENFEKIKSSINEHALNIDLLGRRNDVPQLMCAFDLLILPSLEGEGFPVTLVEAQATGCPCLVSSNVTTEAELGLKLITYIPLSDIDAWVNYIKERKGRRIPRKLAYDHVNNLGFHQDDAAEQWLNVYKGET